MAKCPEWNVKMPSITLVLAQSVLRELLKFKKFTLLLRSPVVKVQHSNSSVTAIYRDPTTQQLVPIKGNLNVSSC
jgi:hypothetical protein